MYKIIIEHIANKYEYEELTKIFLHPDEFKILFPNELETEQINPSDNILYINKENLGDKNMIKAQIFDQLSQIKDTKPSWGILTGVRPVKVAGDLIKQYGLDKARSLLLNEYRVSKEKEELITSTYLYQ